MPPRLCGWQSPSLYDWRNPHDIDDVARQSALKAADGAIGSYSVAVKDAYVAFEKLTREISRRLGGVLPEEQD